MPFPNGQDDVVRLPATGRALPTANTTLADAAAALVAAQGRLLELQPPQPAPRFNEVIPPLNTESGGFGATVAVLAAVYTIVGPGKFITGAKWAFRNLIFGATVVEAAAWVVAFNAVRQANTTTHELQNFFLGWPTQEPLFTQKYSFLERQYSGIPNTAAQRDLAIRFANSSIEQLRRDAEVLNAQPNEIGAQETLILLNRILAIKLDDELNQIKINAAQNALKIAAMQFGVGVWSEWQQNLLGVPAADQQPTGAGPPGSTDP
jgi:hypothetical protein